MPDNDGYPTNDELASVRNWDVVNTSLDEYIAYIKSIWKYPEYITLDGYKWHVSTCGWSGNEMIIAAMKENTMLWMLYWEQSRRGGHYIFSKQRS
jgi:hypothetical protein